MDEYYIRYLAMLRGYNTQVNKEVWTAIVQAAEECKKVIVIK